MTKASDNLFPGIVIRESADDGSDFSNPSADYRRLFLGEDGQLHVKDSAGAVTDIGGAITEITDIPTAETDDTLRLAPDGAGGVEWAAGGGGAQGTELDYVERTSDLSVTGTNEAGAQTYVTSGSVATDGSTVVEIEVYIPNIVAASTAAALIDVFLIEDSTAIGIIGRQRTPAASNNGSTMYAIQRRTPTNASHTWTVKCYVSSGTGTATGGNGTTGNWAPGFIRVKRVSA